MSYEKEDHLHYHENLAVECLQEYLFDMSYEDLLAECQHDQLHDNISENADSCCPVYTATILQLAANNTELATEDSGLGGTSPLDIITQNIYVALEQAQWEWWRDNKDELEEECQIVCDAEEEFDEALEEVKNDPDDDRTPKQIIEAIVLNNVVEHETSIKDEGKDLRELVREHLDTRHKVDTEKVERVIQ